MKGNKMSAILAILLMLSGAIFVPHAFAQEPAGAVTANPLCLEWEYNNPHKPGDTFPAFVDVVDVTLLFSYQVGFYFDTNYFEVVAGSVKEGGFLSHNGVDTVLSFPGTIDNVNGVVTAFGWSLTDTNLAKTGNGHLLNATIKLKNFWPPYTGTYPGTCVKYMDLINLPGDPANLILMYNDGVTEITPPQDHIYDGCVRMYVVEKPPIAYFTIDPPPPGPYYVGELETDDASGSTPGSNGYEDVPIVNYNWDFGDGNVTNTPNPIITHSFSSAGPYTITLIVTDADGRVSQPYSLGKTVIERPLGCVLDVFTQPWRYIDPFFIEPVPQGKGPGLYADLFRPGDYVQLFATTVYNGDPVQNQLVSFEVRDNQGNLVLCGVAISNAGGLAEYDFRIPWPCTGVENEFGIWTVFVTWEMGKKDPPYAWTQNDTLPFKVGWGIYSTGLTTDKPEYYKSENVIVKVHIHNEYLIPVWVLLVADIYDDLMVPIDSPAVLWTLIPAGAWCHPSDVEITFSGIHVEKWAFVGLGTVKCNEFSWWPREMGTAFCPEQVAGFIIKHTFDPQDP